jgi:hypothetical protein
VKTVFEEWRSYDRDVVPTDAPVVQREECRRAFYAGVMAGYALTMDAVAPMDEDRCAANLLRLDREIRSVTKDLRVK